MTALPAQSPAFPISRPFSVVEYKSSCNYPQHVPTVSEKTDLIKKFFGLGHPGGRDQPFAGGHVVLGQPMPVFRVKLIRVSLHPEL